MTWPRLLILTLALVAPIVVAQQTTGGAADAYARAAGLFIDGETERAESAAVEGLRAAPGDAKLQALLDLIRQEQPPQDGGGGEQNDDQGEDESGESGDDSQASQGDQGRPEDEDRSARQDQTRTDPGEDEGDEPSEPQQGGREGEGGDSPQQAPVQPGQMSPEQAARLLDAVGGEERLLLRELRRRPSRVRRSDKDW